MKLLLALLLATIALFFLAQVPPAQGATITVNSTADAIADDGVCTLREAIIAANNDSTSSDTIGGCAAGSGADMIDVPAGTYTLAIAGAGEDANATGDLDIYSDVTIAGAGSSMTIVDGADLDRIFHILSSTTEISDITIQNGSVTDPNMFQGNNNGGGIRNLGTLVLRDSNVENNLTLFGRGGGISSEGGLLEVTRSSLSGNSAHGGGGIWSQFATLTVQGSVISGNSAGSGIGDGSDGGGIATIQGSIDVTDTVFSENSAGRGGAIGGGGTYILNTSTFLTNSAVGEGGGIYHSGGSLTIGRGTFSANTAGLGGGAVYNTATMKVTESTFSGNSATGSGGAILNQSLVDASNVTLDGNNAGLNGGGLQLEDNAIAILTNMTISGNSAEGAGGGISDNGTQFVGVVNTIISNNLPGGNCSGNVLDAFGNFGNLQYPGTDCGATIPSVDPFLLPLANNGGPTQTRAIQSGSPAVDAAVFCPPPPTDQRGVTRPQGAACDIGAFELEASVTAVDVDIDIKLGSDPNCIKNTSKGLIPVAVLGNGVDVTTIDLSTIEIDDDDDPGTNGVASIRSSFRDLNGDSNTDLLLHFRTPELNTAGLLVDGNELFVTADLTDGTPIVGSEHIFLAGGPNCF